METHYITPARLTIHRVEEIIEKRMTLALGHEARERILRCREWVVHKEYDPQHPIYGVTTGFGSLCDVTIDEDKIGQLQTNLVMSHACSTGERVSPEIVRLMLLCKIQSLSYGNSGVQLETVQRLVDFFNLGVLPIVYRLGSLGASGDLAPLANMCLPLVGMGEVEYRGEVMSAERMMQLTGLKRVTLKAKEGLALLNGTQFMSAHGVWAVIKARCLSRMADKIGALSLDAFDGRMEPFCAQVHAVRPHQGQIDTAAAMRTYLEGSELITQPKQHVQDPYSFRCIPQVHGAVKDTLAFVASALETEINSVTDNPTIFPDEDLVVSAGNFHGEPIAMPMDFLSIAMSELANISERRIYKLVSAKRGLPSFLVAKPGVNSGFMIPQYAAAAIVNRNKVLCYPASADSITSSQGQEDHVSMGGNAATKLCEVVENTERVLAIELLNAAQAIEFRRPLRTSPVLEDLVAEYRKQVPFVENDTVMYTLINKSVEFLQRQRP